jgi:hypothetical protein
LSAILSALSLSPKEMRELATEARRLDPALKNALLLALPPEFRPLLYGHQSAASLSSKASIEQHAQPAGIVSAASSVSRKQASKVLIASNVERTANIKLLENEELAPVAASDMAAVENCLKEPTFCGVLVDGSFLQTLAPTEQRDFLKLLAAYSTFWWIRIDGSSLGIDAVAVHDLFRVEWCQYNVPAETHVSIQSSSDLKEHELSYLREARARLNQNIGGIYSPGELTDDQTLLLTAAITEFARVRHYSTDFLLRSMRTRFVAGGMTAAKLALVLVNDQGVPVISKISKKKWVVDEAQRFRRFIQPWDTELRPELFFHHDDAVLLQGLVQDSHSVGKPAPTFEERLRDLWHYEVFGALLSGTLVPSATDLSIGLERAVSKLGRLNRLPAAAPSFQSYAVLDVSTAERLEAKGMHWGFGAAEINLRSRALSHTRGLSVSAIVHGDINLRNLLLRGDRDAFFVDYANSGPGHPAYDLVRLEVALFVNGLREIGAQGDTVAWQHALMNSATPEELEESFAALYCSDVNRVCLAGIVACRRECLAVLQTYGGTELDYAAVKLVICWQALNILALQQGMARAAIEATSELCKRLF